MKIVKTFKIENASFEKFINYKLTHGTKGEIPNYNAEITIIDSHNFIRKVTTDMGFVGILKDTINKIIGHTAIVASEIITYNIAEGNYKCIINDVNEGSHRNYFSFKEEYNVKREGNSLIGIMQVEINNKLQNMIMFIGKYVAKSVENSFHAQRYKKICEELLAAKINPTDSGKVISSDISQNYNKPVEELAKEEAIKLEEQLKNTTEYEEYMAQYNKQVDDYLNGDFEIPIS